MATNPARSGSAHRTSRASTPPPTDLSPGTFSRTYRLHGKNIRVILHDPDLIAEIAPRLEPLLAHDFFPDLTLQATAFEDAYRVGSGETCVATEQYAADARIDFLQEFVRRTFDREWAAILHAGACGTESQCVIFPAETHSGKTTLAAVLMHSGLTLFADDSVALERGTLTIPAMPFALMIREGSWPVVSRYFPGLRDLALHNRYGQNVKFLPPAGSPHTENARAVAIVFSRWDPDVKTTITSLDSFEALVRLKDSGVWVAPEPECIQKFLDWLQSLPICEMVYSDVDEAAAFVKKLLDQ